MNRYFVIPFALLVFTACPKEGPSAVSCTDNSECLNGQSCIDNLCVADDGQTTCLTDAQCLNEQACVNGFCEALVSNTDAGPEDQPNTNADFGITFSTPNDRSTARTWDTVSIKGTVTADTDDLVDLEVSLTSSLDGTIDGAFNVETGIFSAEASLTEGNHAITLEAQRGDDRVSDTINITVCGYQFDEDFSEEPDPEVWRKFDSAIYVEDGWIDMTNNQTSTWGKFFNVAQTVQPGNLDVQFRIYTGQLEEGADGFSMNIIDTPDVASLEKILNCFTGLGNHISPLRDSCELSVEELGALQAFSIEFDTYPNGFQCAASVNPPIDPTCEDHVAITFNGSAMPFYWFPEDWGDYEACGTPGGSWTSYDYRAENGCKYGLECIDDLCLPKYPWWDRELLGYGPPAAGAPQFWAEMENIEDSQWHDVHIVLAGTNATVTFDDEEIINATVPEFDYKGGYLGFTGGSGAIGNYHRFDDLKVKGTCYYTGP